MNAQLKKELAKSKREKLEKKFDFIWKAIDGQSLVSEYKFNPDRRWAADRCHRFTKILLEIEGGNWSNGRHNRGKGFENDCEKYFDATMRGYTIIRLSSNMLTEMVLNRVKSLIEATDQRLSR